MMHGGIGSYLHFEQQVLKELYGIGFQTGLLRRNMGIIAIQAGATSNDKRNIYNSFEQLGFTESYLIQEPLALIKAVQSQEQIGEKCLIIQLEADYLSISVVVEQSISVPFSLHLGQATFDTEGLTKAQGLVKESIQLGLDRIIQTSIFKNHEIQVILAIEGNGYLSLIQDVCTRNGFSQITILNDVRETIIKGLALVTQEEIRCKN